MGKSKSKSRNESRKAGKQKKAGLASQTARSKAEAIAKAAIDETVGRHAEDARVRKERDERVRLATRQLVTGHFVFGILKAIDMRTSNGLHLTEQRIGKVASEHAKLALRELGLESDGKKDKENKSD